MRFGLLLLGEHPPDRLKRLALLAEEHDFEHLWYADEKFFRDPYASLAFLSQYTTRIQLGPCVTDPFTRHPAITAMAMATLDELAGGRGVLGIGAGFSGVEAMGIHRQKLVRTLREAIELIRQLWAGGTVTYQGETVSFHSGELNFSSRPDIPILVASAGPQVLRLAGELADAVMLGDLASPAAIRKALAYVAEGARHGGRAAESLYRITRLNLILSNDLEAGCELMRPWITGDLWHTYPRWDSMMTYRPEWEEELRPLREFIESYGGKPRNVDDFKLVAEYNRLITTEMVREKALVGSADQIVAQIEEIAGAGIQEITLYPLHLAGQDIESVLAAFFERVMPRVQSVLPS
jgi:5,10-methylenetetrahydromethanopterin reductase